MTDQRLRVLQVIGGLNRGGAEMVVVNLCNHVDPASFHLRVCTLMDSVPMAQRIRRPDGIKVLTCGRAPGRPQVRNTIRSTRRFREVVRAFRPDIVHSHLYAINAPLQWIAAAGTSCRHVITFHSVDKYRARRGHAPSAVFRWCESSTVRLCSARVIAVSGTVADTLQSRLSIPSGRIRVIYNGVDTETLSRSRQPASDATRRGLGLSPDDLLVVHVARFYAVKDHRTLLTAWPRVVTDVPRATLLLAGDGPLRREMESLCASLKIADSVRFLGARDDVPALLACSDVGVMPSLSEGMPVAAVEMLSMQLPLLASDIGAFREVVDPPRAGWVVPPGKPALLAEALARLLADPGLRAELGAAGRRRTVEMFSVGALARRHEELYRELATAGG
jgi:glycosyltransferase involved in cell wall biosynthesis